MSEPLYQIQDVRHRYGERTVLQLDELAVYPGEVLALVGPSGAGKSTTQKILIKLLQGFGIEEMVRTGRVAMVRGQHDREMRGTNTAVPHQNGHH